MNHKTSLMAMATLCAFLGTHVSMATAANPDLTPAAPKVSGGQMATAQLAAEIGLAIVSPMAALGSMGLKALGAHYLSNAAPDTAITGEHGSAAVHNTAVHVAAGAAGLSAARGGVAGARSLLSAGK